MTTPSYTYRSAGTDASGTGDITPGLPAGWAAGDLLIMPTSSRNNSDTIPVDPTGWTRFSLNSSVPWNYLYGRIAVGGDTAPTVSYAGSNQHHAQIGCWTGVNIYTDFTTIVSAVNEKSGTSVDILYNALLPLDANCLCIAFATKNKTSSSDGSSVNDLAGFTRVGTLTSGGNNIATWWGYVQQTTATNIPAVTQTRTGAAENLQYGTIVIALKSLPNASHAAARYVALNQM